MHYYEYTHLCLRISTRERKRETCDRNMFVCDADGSEWTPKRDNKVFMCLLSRHISKMTFSWERSAIWTERMIDWEQWLIVSRRRRMRRNFKMTIIQFLLKAGRRFKVLWCLLPNLLFFSSLHHFLFAFGLGGFRTLRHTDPFPCDPFYRLYNSLFRSLLFQQQNISNAL